MAALHLVGYSDTISSFYLQMNFIRGTNMLNYLSENFIFNIEILDNVLVHVTFYVLEAKEILDL